MSTSLSKRAINRQHWSERIQGWKRSGLTQKAFCERHQIGLASFQRWRRLLMTESKPAGSSAVTFLPVKLTTSKAPSLALLVDDLRIEIPVGFDPVTLKQVVQAIQAA